MTVDIGFCEVCGVGLVVLICIDVILNNCVDVDR
ncbi:predicted protein [Sclerotinia sclerotiorum 1980 UF-70]|uniref:Uncharacterized protein n=1 Tax=Sclerotinia sclerotiorum (strain ATCC 18683 / 1980 / Ss-1) TaxID=665079 RepID=A7EHG9_SCLS1|nr:predicted protein [Sclerotinia sclerotiorum 1980 UF-70]EDO02285.1 predicted protein [Sclerotinia sclerotiorum 1980 UF-70]